MKFVVNFKGKKGFIDCPIDKKGFDKLDKIMFGKKNFIKINNGWFNLDNINLIEMVKEDE